MIDNPAQAERLLAKLRECLPLSATITPALATIIRERSPGIDASQPCRVTRIDYAGDEGGIVCKLDRGLGNAQEVFFVSITHLAFPHAGPLAREIAEYQKHRIKRLRRSRT